MSTSKNLSAVDEFITKVENTYEVEYGDFRRKVSQYLQRLEEALGASKGAETRKILKDIRTRIVFQPRPNIDQARSFVVEQARKIKN